MSHATGSTHINLAAVQVHSTTCTDLAPPAVLVMLVYATHLISSIRLGLAYIIITLQLKLPFNFHVWLKKINPAWLCDV